MGSQAGGKPSEPEDGVELVAKYVEQVIKLSHTFKIEVRKQHFSHMLEPFSPAISISA